MDFGEEEAGIADAALTALDHIEHETGTFSAEDIATLERLDGIIGKVREAAEHVASGHAIVAVVSDHGFANYDQQLNLFAAFREAKLFTVDDKGKITDWRAMPWETGGSAAIVLKRVRRIRRRWEKCARCWRSWWRGPGERD